MRRIPKNDQNISVVATIAAAGTGRRARPFKILVSSNLGKPYQKIQPNLKHEEKVELMPSQ